MCCEVCSGCTLNEHLFLSRHVTAYFVLFFDFYHFDQKQVTKPRRNMEETFSRNTTHGHNVARCFSASAALRMRTMSNCQVKIRIGKL